jgi:hypothetical protein
MKKGTARLLSRHIAGPLSIMGYRTAGRLLPSTDIGARSSRSEAWYHWHRACPPALRSSVVICEPIMHRARLAVLLLPALVLYGLFLPFYGTEDVTIWLSWMDQTVEQGVPATYAVNNGGYPPGAFMVLNVMERLSRATGLSPHAVLKGTLALASVAAAGVLLAWSGNPTHAVVLLIAVAVNGAALGYLDVLMAPLLLLAIFAFTRTRFSAAGALFAAALLIKWFPLIIGPFFAAALFRGTDDCLRWRDGLRRLSQAALGALVVIVPIVAWVNVGPVLGALRFAMNHPALSFQGLNANWLIQLFIYLSQHGTGPLWSPDAPTVMAIMRAAFWASYALLLGLFVLRGRGPADFIWYACVGFYTYCMLATGVHENHLFLAPVLACGLLASRHRDAVWLAIYLGVSANLNLVLFYGLSGAELFPQDPLTNVPLLGVTVIVSATNVLVWALLMRRALLPAAAKTLGTHARLSGP